MSTAFLRETSDGRFADTFYWIAVTTPDDGAYARALEFSRS